MPIAITLVFETESIAIWGFTAWGGSRRKYVFFSTSLTNQGLIFETAVRWLHFFFSWTRNTLLSLQKHKKRQLSILFGNPEKIVKTQVVKNTGAFQLTEQDHVWLIETCLSERSERKRRISKETANTDVAFYLLGRWGVITANFNQFRSIIHGQGPIELISKMPLLSRSLSLFLTARYE